MFRRWYNLVFLKTDHISRSPKDRSTGTEASGSTCKAKEKAAETGESWCHTASARVCLEGKVIESALAFSPNKVSPLS